MDSQYRLAATVIIWTAFVIIAGIIGGVIATVGSLDSLSMGMVLVIALALLAAVTQSTQAIWSSGQKIEDETPGAKTKRQGRRRVERLIQDLDDHEIYDLEALLLARDDDAVRQQSDR